ncbi:MAG: group 1 truncated hemoglobin [Candidatus Eisenbacteria bacterium]|nr:group 1 truncated hemoglobin [Candidatus Eisenbacteria bacterium]
MKPLPLARSILFATLLAASCVSCRSAKNAAPAAAEAGATLYSRLGGEAGIRAVVGQFVANLAADTRINHYFADTDLDPLKASFVNLIGQSTGGPQKYAGRDMKTTHAGMGITTADFSALIEDLTQACDQFKVGEKEKGELLAILGPFQKDIVEK